MRHIWTIFTLMLFALPARAGLEMYFVHSDHLGTPKVITDKSRQVVWKGHMTPFGEMDVEVEAVTNRQRFPGQRFDIESRLHYNYFRDYDPGLGRYVQSDPFGLRGGLNTYAYVKGNPLVHTDRYGLVGTLSSDNDKQCATVECAMYGGTEPENASRAPVDIYMDMRTNEEIECASCKFACGLYTLAAPGPLVPLSARELAQFGATITLGQLFCNLVCSDKCSGSCQR